MQGIRHGALGALLGLLACPLLGPLVSTGTAPAWWPTGNAENFIESIAAGLASPQATFERWLGSPQQRQAILGENQFYADQTNYGIGYFAGGPRRYYWVVLTAPPPGS
jgi:hypothetical protein